MFKRIKQHLNLDHLIDTFVAPLSRITIQPSSQRSFSRELSISLILTVVVVSAIVIPLSYLVFYYQAQNQLDRVANFAINDLSQMLETPLQTGDIQTIEEHGRIFTRNDYVEQLSISDDQGNLYFSLDKERSGSGTKQSIQVSKDGQVIGRIQLSLIPPYAGQLSRIFLINIFVVLAGFFALTVLTGYLSRRMLKRPLQELTHAVKMYEIGRFDSVQFRSDYSEFDPLVHVLADTQDKINSYVVNLRQTEEKYRSIFENALEGIFQTSLTGRFISANPTAARILGYETAEELIDSFTDLSQQLYVDPERRQALLDRIQDGQVVSGFEAEMYRQDGKKIWVAIDARPVFDEQCHTLLYIEGLFQDITKRKEAEAALQQHQRQLEEQVERRTAELVIAVKQREHELEERKVVEQALRNSEQLISAIFDTAQVGLAVFDEKGYFVRVNQAYCDIYGREADEFMGQTFTLVLPPEAEESAMQLHKEFIAGEAPITMSEWRVRRKDGTRLTVNVAHSLLVAADGRRYRIGAFLDITQTVQAEQELRASEASYRDLALQNAKLYEEMRRNAETKATLLQEINHRVKNNLAAIIRLLSVQQRYAQQRESEAAYLFIQDLIQRVQGLATVHRLLSDSQWSPISLDYLVSQVIESVLQLLPADKKIEVVISTSPVRVGADQANHLALAVNEITTNVSKYALTDHKQGQLNVTISEMADRVQLEFRDTGPGYPAEVLRSDQQTLGVHLIRTIVEDNLAGQFELANEGGAVTRIYFTPLKTERSESIELEQTGQPVSGLDIPPPVPGQSSPDDGTPPAGGAQELQNMRLLLVDDHPLFLIGMRDTLLAHGIHVVGTANNGLVAQEQARVLRPDMILMDLEMPLCNGLEATRRIMAELPHVRIVILTASESEAHLFEALKSGACGYLLKGLQDAEFFDMLTGAARGEATIAPALASRILNELASQTDGQTASPDVRPDPNPLSPRQTEVLGLVARGMTYKEVAAALHLSEATIKYHMGQILAALQLASRREAIAYARRFNLDR